MNPISFAPFTAFTLGTPFATFAACTPLGAFRGFRFGPSAAGFLTPFREDLWDEDTENSCEAREEEEEEEAVEEEEEEDPSLTNAQNGALGKT